MSVSSTASVIVPLLDISLVPFPRLSDCISNPITNGPAKFIIAWFSNLLPVPTLSIVAILEPPSRKSWLLYDLPAAFSLALSAVFKGFTESTVKFCVNVAVPPLV